MLCYMGTHYASSEVWLLTEIRQLWFCYDMLAMGSVVTPWDLQLYMCMYMLLLGQSFCWLLCNSFLSLFWKLYRAATFHLSQQKLILEAGPRAIGEFFCIKVEYILLACDGL